MFKRRVQKAIQWLKEKKFTIQIVIVSALSLVLFFTVIHPLLVAIHPAFAFGSEALDSRGGSKFIAYLIVGTVVVGNIALIAGKMYFEFDEMNLLGVIMVFFAVIGLLLPESLSDRYFKLLPSGDNDVKDGVGTDTASPFISHGKMLDKETCYRRIRQHRFESLVEHDCVYCGYDYIIEIGNCRGLRQYNCEKCKTESTDITGTLFAQYDIPIEEQFFICDELQSSVPLSQIAEELDCDVETIQNYAEDLRACTTDDINDLTVTDICESDIFSVEQKRTNDRYSENSFPGAN